MKKAEATALNLLKDAVLNNQDAQKGGSKFIVGYVGDEQSAQHIKSFLQKKGLNVFYTGKSKFSLNQGTFIYGRSSGEAAELCSIRISASDGKLIDLEKFEKDYGVTVHRTAALGGDVSEGARSHDEALKALAESCAHGAATAR